MSEKKHQVHCFEFINRTRYSSEDIAAMLEKLAELAVRRGSSADAPLVLTHYRARDRTSMVYDIADYKPAQVWEERQVWDSGSGKRSRQKVAHYINPPGHALSTCWRLNIVPPDKLYENHVEALTAPQGVAPTLLVKQFMTALTSMLRPNSSDVWTTQQSWREEAMGLVEQGALTLRILPARENPAQSASKKNRTARSRLSISVANAQDELLTALGASEASAAKFRDALDNCHDARVSSPVKIDEFVSMVNAISTLSIRLQAFREALETS